MLAKVVGLYNQPPVQDAPPVSAAAQKSEELECPSPEIDAFLQEIIRNLLPAERMRLSDSAAKLNVRYATDFGIYNLLAKAMSIEAEKKKAKCAPKVDKTIQPSQVVDELLSFTDLEEAAAHAQELPDPLDGKVIPPGSNGQAIPLWGPGSQLWSEDEK
jgi:hypothetical protein